MGGLTFDWIGVLGGAPLEWLELGVLTTLYVTFAGFLVATLIAIVLLGLRISEKQIIQWPAITVVAVFRNTPLLVQILFWYFAGFGLLPADWRAWINDDHSWAMLPGGVGLLTPEFLAATWGLGVFSGVFIAEEIRAGLMAVAPGQREAALAQGFGHWRCLGYILLPQALANAWQPVVGQYLNLMKLSSLAAAIGLAEITYQVRQIESYNSHALEAFAVGTLLYLAIGMVMGQILLRCGPRSGTMIRGGIRRGP
ncbi:amino acid ABC transporter permease [Telmatospirillum siberiense]|uniref:ABC transmembrane type-1 domain-containing protein n=1 Tax=Telmatospirillum siberiense TaxID=382514 RepID=A0A2N3PX20_9PROT|nr:amino acid ABC transporter permease [Telmatospirillum siberiense]PKU24946.1 hypothetical protein CWS72_08710 [Telmatospirillum siberiense]